MQLVVAGSNARGQLSTGDTVDRHKFTPCSFDDQRDGILPEEVTSVIHVAGGANHTLLLTENANVAPPVRHLWGTGDGNKGQLGPFNTANHLHTFHKIDISLSHTNLHDHSLISIAACWETSFVVVRPPSDDVPDVVLSFGANDFGDAGCHTPIFGSFNMIKFNPAIQASGLDAVSPHVFRVQRLAAGLHHVVVILRVRLRDGTDRDIHVGWGASRHGQLQFEVQTRYRSGPRLNGAPAFLPIPTFIPPLLTPDHTITSLALGQQHTVISEEGAGIRAAGSNRKGQLQGLDGIHDAASVHCTWNGTYVVATGKGPDAAWEVLATGSSQNGQLGRSEPSPSSPSSPASSTLNQSHLGIGLHPVSLPFSTRGKRLVQIVCGSEHVVIVVNDHDGSGVEVWGWGYNEHGNLGLQRTEDVFVPTKMWPNAEFMENEILGAWAGCATTWICIT